MRPFYETYKSVSNENSNRSQSSGKMLRILLNVRNSEAVLTHQESNFTSLVIESLWDCLDVHTLRTTAYHPQTDGITERFNRTIKTMLTQFVHYQKQDDWDTKLAKLSFAYNTAVHAVTKFSPFELMFGRIPKLPINLVYNQTDSVELRAKIDVEWIASDFVDQQKEEMKAIFDFAAANRDAVALKASTMYDRTVREANFKVGDKVWVLDQGSKAGTNPKLRPRWKGPYLLTDLLNEVNAILKAETCKKDIDCTSLLVEEMFRKTTMLCRLTAESIRSMRATW